MNEHFRDLWQCHECHRILGPDDLGTHTDHPDGSHYTVDLATCKPCGSIDIDLFSPADLCKELERMKVLPKKPFYAVDRDNLEQIQIILERVFEL